MVTEQGIQPDPSKVSAIEKFPCPTNTKSLKSFLGLVGYYRKFIRDFSKISNPLFSLLKKNVIYHWSPFCDEAFRKLKNAIISSPIFQFPDFSKIFTLTTDASANAIGSVLSQENDNFDLPVAFASRVLNKAEKNYSTIEKELLSIVWSVKTFRPYLYGRHFIVNTDHKPLIWLWNLKEPSFRLMRWRIKLEEFDFEIKFKTGKTNTNADALSRVQITSNEANVHALTRSKSSVLTDDNCEVVETKPTLKATSDSVDTKINFKNNRTTITDEKIINDIIREYHDTPQGGHQGIARTVNRIKQDYYFPKMYGLVGKYIKNCRQCQVNKHLPNNKIPLKITTTASKPFEKIFLDIVGPLPISHLSNKFILTVQDDLIKFTLAFPLPNQEAESVAKTFSEEFICKFGVPESLLTDQGSNFMSELFQRICQLFQIKKLNSTAYHPETNGSLERFHKTLGEYLRNFTDKDPANWDSWLPYATFSYNSTPHSVTGFSPFELLFAYKPNIPSSISDYKLCGYNL